MNQRRYRYYMPQACEAGETRHPQLVILELAPDAADLEPLCMADAWDFTAQEIEDPPAFIFESPKRRE